jgi:hypothetical protein
MGAGLLSVRLQCREQVRYTPREFIIDHLLISERLDLAFSLEPLHVDLIPFRPYK